MKRRPGAEPTGIRAQACVDDGQASAAEAIPRHRFTELGRVPLQVRLGSFTAKFLSWGFIDGSKGWRNYLHMHTHYEICYAFAGRGIFRMLGTDYAVKRGDLFIAKPREEHEIVADVRDPLGIYFWSFTLLREGGGGKPPPRLPPFSAPPLSGSPGPASEAALDGLVHAFSDSKRWVSTRAPGMERTLELMTEEIVRREAGHVQVLGGLAAKLILDTVRAGVGDPWVEESGHPRVSDPAQGRVALARQYMRDNLGRNLSLAQIAAQVNLSVRQLTRLFQQAAGRSPVEVLTTLRLEAAAQLLADRNLPIKEIAARAGYPDVRYFTTVFRRHMGLPPAAYRAKGGTRFRDPQRDLRLKAGHVPGGRKRRS